MGGSLSRKKGQRVDRIHTHHMQQLYRSLEDGKGTQCRADEEHPVATFYRFGGYFFLFRLQRYENNLKVKNRYSKRKHLSDLDFVKLFLCFSKLFLEKNFLFLDFNFRSQNHRIVTIEKATSYQCRRNLFSKKTNMLFGNISVKIIIRLIVSIQKRNKTNRKMSFFVVSLPID